MKVSKPGAILLMFILILPVQKGWCKVISGYMNNYLFYTSSTNKPYLETTIQINGQSILYKHNTNNRYQGKIEVTLIYYHDSVVVNHYKYALNTPELTDTVITHDAIDMKRTEIPLGANRVELLLSDMYSPLHFTQSISQSINVKALSAAGVSDIELVDHYLPEQNPSVFSKNGYDIIPRTTMHYGALDSTLIFFTEFYHLNTLEKGNITFTYSISSAFENNKVVPVITGYTRQKAESDNIVFSRLDIKDLATDNYVLTINAYSVKGVLLQQQSVFFKKTSGKKSALTTSLSLGLFAYINADSLDFYLKAVYYTIGGGSKQTILNCIQGTNVLAKRVCLRDFWYDIYTKDAEYEFSEFRKKVLYVEATYAAVKKHGFQTDRGRVYLQYGPPDYVEQHRRDIDTYPYDLWQYYQTKDQQNNVLFVFYALDMASENFILVHSTARGETYNTNWTQVVSRTQNPSLFGNTPSFIR